MRSKLVDELAKLDRLALGNPFGYSCFVHTCDNFGIIIRYEHQVLSFVALNVVNELVDFYIKFIENVLLQLLGVFLRFIRISLTCIIAKFNRFLREFPTKLVQLGHLICGYGFSSGWSCLRLVATVIVFRACRKRGQDQH
ncbi:hypothetical protein D3C78_1066380 [compost metagenome]